MKKKGNYTKLENSGTFRAERNRSCLQRYPALMDERSLPELLNYISELSKYVPFFNLNDKDTKKGWSVFFNKDISFILAKIAVYDLKSLEKDLIDYNLSTSSYQLEKSENKQTFKQNILELIKELELWHTITRPFNNDYGISGIISQTVEKIYEDWSLWIKEFQTNDKYLSKSTSIFQNLTDYINDKSKTSSTNNREKDDLQFVYRLLFRSISTIVTSAKNEFPKTLLSSKHAPQAAMMIGFLKLFQHNQQHLNQFTRKHLDYYFYKILGIQARPAEADYTFIKLYLSKSRKQLKLPSGTEFFASISEDGVETRYKTHTETLLTTTEVKAIKTLFVESDPDVDMGGSYLFSSGIYTHEHFKPIDEDLNFPFWSTFGQTLENAVHKDSHCKAADIGFLITSPTLLLEGGRRRIKLFLFFTSSSFSKFKHYIDDIALQKKELFQTEIERLFSKAFDIELSTNDGWLSNLNYEIEVIESNREKGIQIILELPETAPPITPTTTIFRGQELPKDWPILKILLQSKERLFVYSLLEVLQIECVKIQVEVQGLKHLLLFNEFGQLNSANPFLPFGPLPKQKSYLLLGSPELKPKELEELKINIEWFDLPDIKGGFNDYYSSYPTSMNNDDFIVSLSALSNYRFLPFDKEERQKFNLFKTNEKEVLHPNITFYDINPKKLGWVPDYTKEPFKNFDINSKNAYLKLELIAPEVAFGHGIYPQIFADATIAKVNIGLNKLFTRNKSIPETPNEPYTPKINHISVDYVASSTLQFNQLKARENKEKSGDEFHLLYPFGTEQTFGKGIAKSDNLLPSYRDQGNLYIGFEDIEPTQVVSLFFKLNESHLNNSSDGISDPTFFYLSSNEWIRIETKNILSDDTQSFTTSGIIKIKVGKNINRENTIIDNRFYWIRISILEGADQISETHFSTPTTNVAQVFWIVNDNPDHFSNTIPRSPVKELVNASNAIEDIEQLDHFYGGRTPENQTQLYTRISERLRHKNRAVSLWDYEHLILEHFQEIEQVKCIGYNQYRPFIKEGKTSINRGQVIVVIIPKLRMLNDYIKGDIHLLERVRSFLNDKKSVFSDVKVMYPSFENIRVNGLVKFKTPTESGLLLEKLLIELNEFICPWVNKGALPLGEKINIFEIYRFIESRPYVVFFTQFSVIHIHKEGNQIYHLKDSYNPAIDSNIIQPNQPWSTIIPLKIQGISTIEKETYQAPKALTMEQMYIGNDVILPSKD